MREALSTWDRRRWYAAAGSAVLTVLVIALPTALLPNPVFGRAIPPTWWSWPVLLLTAVLGGLLAATYVRRRDDQLVGSAADSGHLDRKGLLGGLLAYLAVGCPVCNKLALLALGAAGAQQWFAPIQPVLAIGALGLLAWALKTRLDGDRACPLPTAAGPGPRA